MAGRCIYRCDQKSYDDYYLSQVGGSGIPVFRGGKNLYGGGIFSGLFKAVAPLLRSGGKSLIKKGAETGMKIVGDVLSGQNLKQAAKKRSIAAGRELFHQAIGGAKKRIKLASQPSSSQTRRRHVTKRKTSNRKKTPRGRGHNPRGKNSDIFG